MHPHPVHSNIAAWLTNSRLPLEVGSAPDTQPRAGELVIRTHAVAVNPVDWLIPLIGRFVYPWLKSPAILGFDLAGEVLETGPGVTRFQVGDRMLALVVGTEKSRNTPAEGAFQQRVVVLDRLTCPLPDHLTYEQGAVLPLGLSTAACGLFQKNQLALQHPSATPVATGQTFLIWGGLDQRRQQRCPARHRRRIQGFATASPRNFGRVRSLCASQVFDYRSETVVRDLIVALQGQSLAGALSIASGSAGACIDVLRACGGQKVLALASTPVSFERLGQHPRSPLLLPRLMGRMLWTTAALQLKARRAGVRTNSI